MTHDAVVPGLGGMGSAAAAHLAARGLRVLGLERFGPAHDRGSSHGGSRIIRQSYFEAGVGPAARAARRDRRPAAVPHLHRERRGGGPARVHARPAPGLDPPGRRRGAGRHPAHPIGLFDPR